MVDLHTHSTASDGTLTPRELIEEAARRGIREMALTDHDTVSGVAEAQAAGRRHGVTVIAGIELEIGYTGGTFHLLGLGLDPGNERLLELLSDVADERTNRNLRMIGHIREAGIEADYDSVASLAAGSIVGRPHFAQFLVESGLVSTEQAAFQEYLGEGRPFYEPRRRLSLRKASRIIHEAGGRAVVAHPKTLRLKSAQLAEHLAQWQSEGLDGIEAFHSNASYPECREMEEMAKKLNLLTTAGSDYHGPQRSDRKLGHTTEEKPIADRFFAPFRQAARDA
jgi:hypothetical protein